MAPWGTGLKRQFVRGLLRQPTGDNMEPGFCNHLLKLAAVETPEVLLLHQNLILVKCMRCLLKSDMTLRTLSGYLCGC
jgi:hypothetical protein